MKIKYFFGMVGIIWLLFSCAKREFYSCDPKADKWARKNIAWIRTLDYPEWLTIPDKSHRDAAYVALTSDQKTDFWTQKLNECLTLNWSPEEREHIAILINFIKDNNIFAKDVDDNFEAYEAEWTGYAKEVLHWDMKVLYGITGTLEKLTDTKGTLKHNASMNEAQIP